MTDWGLTMTVYGGILILEKKKKVQKEMGTI